MFAIMTGTYKVIEDNTYSLNEVLIHIDCIQLYATYNKFFETNEYQSMY